MHKRPISGGVIHDAVAMWTRTSTSPAQPGYRIDTIAMRLADGTTWVLPQILVPVGDRPLGFRASAWSLKRQRLGNKPGCWHRLEVPTSGLETAGVKIRP